MSNHAQMRDNAEDVVRQVTAQEASELENGRTVKMEEKKYICPFCGEYLALTQPGKKIAYFRHGKGDPASYCEERSKASESGYSLIEESSLKLYLYKRRGSFSLQVKLRPVPFQNDDRVIIDNRKYVISEIASCNEYRFITLNSAQASYTLTYNNKSAENRMRHIWGVQIQGITQQGAFFSCHSNGGSMKAINDSLYFDETYYLVSKMNQVFQSNFGIICKKVGTIFSEFNVFEVKINKNKRAHSIEKDLRDRFKLYLGTKLSNANILWPPLLYNNGIACNYFNAKQFIDVFKMKNNDHYVYSKTSCVTPFYIIDTKIENHFLLILPKDKVPGELYLDRTGFRFIEQQIISDKMLIDLKNKTSNLNQMTFPQNFNHKEDLELFPKFDGKLFMLSNGIVKYTREFHYQEKLKILKEDLKGIDELNLYTGIRCIAKIVLSKKDHKEKKNEMLFYKHTSQLSHLNEKAKKHLISLSNENNTLDIKKAIYDRKISNINYRRMRKKHGIK